MVESIFRGVSTTNSDCLRMPMPTVAQSLHQIFRGYAYRLLNTTTPAEGELCLATNALAIPDAEWLGCEIIFGRAGVWGGVGVRGRKGVRRRDGGCGYFVEVGQRGRREEESCGRLRGEMKRPKKTTKQWIHFGFLARWGVWSGLKRRVSFLFYGASFRLCTHFTVFVFCILELLWPGNTLFDYK